jgi:hypothetical protein
MSEPCVLCKKRERGYYRGYYVFSLSVDRKSLDIGIVDSEGGVKKVVGLRGWVGRTVPITTTCLGTW